MHYVVSYYTGLLDHKYFLYSTNFFRLCKAKFWGTNCIALHCLNLTKLKISTFNCCTTYVNDKNILCCLVIYELCILILCNVPIKTILKKEIWYLCTVKMSLDIHGCGGRCLLQPQAENFLEVAF